MADATSTSGTYSFLDVLISITGPGISVASLSTIGYASEGAKVSMVDAKNRMVIGADGSSMMSLSASKGGHLTLSLLKTGQGNALLSQAYNTQTTSSANNGRNTITINNPISGDNITLQNAAFEKLPDLVYATEGNVMEWSFLCGQVDMLLGNGFQNTGI